jgi:hypothetical protein
MKPLLSNEIKGYAVRKMAKEVVEGDIIFITQHVLHVKEIISDGRTIEFVSNAAVPMAGIGPKTFLNCIQKEDPAIQIAINEKIEALKSHKKLAKSKAEHFMATDAHIRHPTSCSPHLWMIMETSDEYEYWKDNVYGIRVLFKWNKICCIAANTGDEPLICNDGILILDCKKYNFGKYIWR